MNELSRQVLRVVDANFNRSREGLRVCEDIARFMLCSKPLSSELKKLRHGITQTLSKDRRLRADILMCRDSSHDIGKKPAPYMEVKRSCVEDVFAANMERSKESLRVLEEFFKIIDTNISAGFSRLRFRAYAIEAKALKKMECFSRSCAKDR